LLKCGVSSQGFFFLFPKVRPWELYFAVFEKLATYPHKGLWCIIWKGVTMIK